MVYPNKTRKSRGLLVSLETIKLDIIEASIKHTTASLVGELGSLS
jgi:hypothetical protein